MQHKLFTPHCEWLAIASDLDGVFLSDRYLDARERMLSMDNGAPLTLEQEEALFIACNMVALQTIVDKTRGRFSKLFLFMGTKRQDFSTDDLNCRLKGTVSGFLAFEFLTRFFEKALPEIEVVFVPISNADISIGDEPSEANIGVTFTRATQHLNGVTNLVHPEWQGVDDSKYTIAYLHAHYLGQLAKKTTSNPPKRIVYAFIDDMQAILAGLTELATKHACHFPAPLSLVFIQHSDECQTELGFKLSSTPEAMNGYLPGTGEVDETYMQTLKSIQNAHAIESHWPEQNYKWRGLVINHATLAAELFEWHRVTTDLANDTIKARSRK